MREWAAEICGQMSTGQLSAHRHYDLMPHKPAMPECPSTTFSNPSNASKLFSPAFTEETADRGKGGQIFEEGTSSPDSREQHLRIEADSRHQRRVCCDPHSCHVRLSVIKFESECYLLVNVARLPRAMIWPEVSVSLTTT